MICPKCGQDGLQIYHTNEFCRVAGALSPESPDPAETFCNVENCMIISCLRCGYRVEEEEENE